MDRGKVLRLATAPLRLLRKALTAMVSPPRALGMLLLPRTRYDYARDVGDGLGSSVVVAPVLWAARAFPEAPLALWRRLPDGEMERVGEHPLLDLVEYPNPYYSGPLLWMATVVDFMVTGNAYWAKVRDRRGQVTELWYIPAPLIEPVRPPDGSAYISHYEYRAGVQLVRLEPSDVVHFRYGIDPNNTAKGLSPLASLLREIFTDDEAANFTASLLRNLGVPGVVIAPKDPDQEIPEEEAETIKLKWKQRFGGDNRGEPLVLGGPVQVMPLGFSPGEMDLKALRRIPEERVSAVLGVPAIVAGLGAGLDRSTFANYAEAREAAYESLIIPMQRLLAAELQTQLLPEFERDYRSFRVGFDLSNVRVLQEDVNRAAERWAVLVRNGIATRGEARAAFGLPVDDEVDDVYLVPVNVVPERASRQPAQLTPEARALRLKAVRERERRLVLALRRDAERLEAVFARELEREFEGLGRRAEEAYLAVAAPKARGGNGTKQDEGLDAALIDAIIAAMRIEDWQATALTPLFERHYLRVLEATVDTINAVLELGVDLPDYVQRNVVALGGKRVGLLDVVGETREGIFRGLTEARTLGMGPFEAARRIRELVPAGRFVNAGPQYRAVLIARTETKYAQNVSSILAYRQSPAVIAVQVLDAQLGPTDEECELLDGRVVSLDEAERLAEEEHPNGTRNFAPVTR